MIEIPRSLHSLFSATVRQRGDEYVIEIPGRAVDYDAVVPGETYRVAILEPYRHPDRSGENSISQELSKSGGRQPMYSPPVDKGERRNVTVEAVGDQGDGIAKVERGYVVIVPGTEPGEEVTVEIEQVRKNVAFAQVIENSSGT